MQMGRRDELLDAPEDGPPAVRAERQGVVAV
jgi:hypothetical protein